jgi:hypothetical protein
MAIKFNLDGKKSDDVDVTASLRTGGGGSLELFFTNEDRDCYQTIATLFEDGTYDLIPLDPTIAKLMGIQLDENNCIKQHRWEE